MSFLSFSKHTEKLVAVVDIGSASVGAALLKIEKDGPSSIVRARRVVIPSAERNTSQTISAITTALLDATQKKLTFPTAEGGKPLAPASLSVVVRAPWTSSKAIHIREHFKEEEKITEALIEKLSQQALADNKINNNEELLEANVMRVELNGHPTGEPVGKRARDITIHILVSQINAEIKKSITTALQTSFPALRPTWRSHIRAVISFIREHQGFPQDSCIIDMTNEGTAISVIRDSMLTQQAIADSGVDKVLELLSPKGLPEETLGLLRMVERDQCAGGLCDELKGKMGEVEPEIVRRFAESLGTLAIERSLPNTLLLFTHLDLSSWLGHFFSRLDFSQFTVTTQPFAVATISPKDLQRWVLCAPGANTDSSLLLAAALVHTEFNHT